MVSGLVQASWSTQICRSNKLDRGTTTGLWLPRIVVVTIVGAAGVTTLVLVPLLVVAVLVILDDIGTETLLLEIGGSGTFIPLVEADVDGIVEAVVTITLLDVGWIPAVVDVTVAGAMVVDGAIVISGGGTIFMGC